MAFPVVHAAPSCMSGMRKWAQSFSQESAQEDEILPTSSYIPITTGRL